MISVWFKITSWLRSIAFRVWRKHKIEWDKEIIALVKILQAALDKLVKKKPVDLKESKEAKPRRFKIFKR